MSDSSKPERRTEEWWRKVLTDPKEHFEPLRRYLIHLPSAPHCKMCGAPFKGVGGFILGSIGLRPWQKNPSICRACSRDIQFAG